MNDSIPLATVADAHVFFGRLFAAHLCGEDYPPVADYLARVRADPPDTSRYLAAAEAIGATTYARHSAATLYRDFPNMSASVRTELKKTRMFAFASAVIHDRREKSVLKTLRAAEIEVLPFKGNSLEKWLALPELIRPRGDIDLFIHREDLPKAVKHLEEKGWEPECSISMVPKDAFRFHMYHSSRFLLELHMEAYRDLSPTFFTEVWERGDSAVYLDCNVKRPDPSQLFILLAQHYILHGWKATFKWNADIAVFAAALNGLYRTPYLDGVFTPGSLVESALEFYGLPQVLIALHFAEKICGIPVPEELLDSAGELPPKQRKLLEKFDSGRAWEAITPERIIFALRSSSGARTSCWKTLWPSAEFVSMNTGVPPGSLLFPLARLRWLSGRIIRAVKMLLGTGGGINGTPPSTTIDELLEKKRRQARRLEALSPPASEKGDENGSAKESGPA